VPGPVKSPKPTIVELRRPKPVRPAEEPETPESSSAPLLDKPTRPSADADGATTGEGGDYESKLKRPVTRPSRRTTKPWEKEETEEETAAAAKTAKEKARAKRRQVALDEDDEEADLEALQAGMPAPTQVSLSIARPPKPKSTAQPKPAPQQNRGPVSRPRRQTSRDRRERNVDTRPQRPEILTISEEMTVGELAKGLVVPETDIIKKLFMKGVAVNINQTLDIPTIEMVAEEYEVLVETAEKEAQARKVTEMLDAHDMENLQRRPPVVTIMGHVDHGKTTLLDSIRKTKVAQGEAGGITQHIGAYHVDIVREGVPQQIVFLDTPGHEAFTAMRARGARVTDIAILVVAADDGVQPQTIEAISHARAAGVPIVVAINKMDKEGAQADRVKQELSDRGLVPEEWGGDTIMVPVSAIRGENLDTLLEMLVLVSEVEELSANPNRPAKGTVIEAHLDRARGPVATLLVQNGTLRVGDVVLAGPVVGKVRAMIGDRGDRVDDAAPSFAVEVLGFNEVPAAGDEFDVFANEREAKSLASDRGDVQRQSRLQQAMSSRRVSLTGLSDRAQEGELKELNLVVKADVQGSVEAILGSLQQLPQNEVQVRVLFSAAGEVTETDVDLAAASDAVIIGFNTTLASGARKAADDAGVDVREYTVIYKLLDEIQAAMEGLLDPLEVEEALGQAEVRVVFSVGRSAVAGCYIQQGKLLRDCRVRVHRGKQLVYDGRLHSLRRVKDDVKEVNSGYECGVGIDNFSDWAEGDIIEAFKMVAQRRTLSPV
jgi:translation initiation factor IF-2